MVSRYGSAVLPVHVESGIAQGQLFATFQSPDIFLNALTGPHHDSVAGTPEYKVTAVRIEHPPASPPNAQRSSREISRPQ